MGKNPDWFGKLTPAAQLAAIGMEMDFDNRSTPRLQYENGLNLNFDYVSAKGYSADLEAAADLVLSKAYRRVEYSSYAVSAQPIENKLKWEIKAAALEAQLKSHGNRGKIPSIPVFVDLMKTAETAEQQFKLAELSKEPGFKESLQYSDAARMVAQSFNDVAARGKATQQMFYEVMYNFELRGNSEPEIQYNAMNYQTLKEAKAELLAQKSVDSAYNEAAKIYNETAKLNKKLKEENLSAKEKDDIQKKIDELQKIKPISGIANIDLVAKYRPEFFEQSSKMTPKLCEELLNKYGYKLPAQTQLEMMTKVVGNLAQESQKSHVFSEQDYRVVSDYIEKATKLNTSSRAMKTFLKTLRPVVERAQTQYEKDKSFLEKSAIARQESWQAEEDLKIFKNARMESIKLNEKLHKIKNIRDEAKLKEPTDEVLETFFAEVKNGNKEAKLEFIPKSGLGKLFMNKTVKNAQDDIKNRVVEVNDILHDFAKKSEFEYVKEVSGDKTYYDMLAKKEDNVTKINKGIRENRYNYTSAEEKRVATFQQNKIADKFAALTSQIDTRLAEIKGRSRTNLAMHFDGQEFDGKPMSGLIKEEQMAQGIYKEKISELRQAIQDGIKQDMTERGVDQKPDKENPNATGKPMTAENTRKIRRNMKNLKQYQNLVHT